jgi:hypothetical protein
LIVTVHGYYKDMPKVRSGISATMGYREQGGMTYAEFNKKPAEPDGLLSAVGKTNVCGFS